MKTKNLKMVIVFAVILLAIVVFSTNTVNATTDEIVNIKDSKLKAELLTYDTNKDGELSKAEMESIMELELENKGIIDLSGLENAVNLTNLSLSNNNISDISALSKLTKLQFLYLSNCNITDITALKDMTNLYSLNLSHNNIENISALSNIAKIIKLEKL